MFVCLFICSKKHLINSNNVQQNWSTQGIKVHSLRPKNCQGTHVTSHNTSTYKLFRDYKNYHKNTNTLSKNHLKIKPTIY